MTAVAARGAVAAPAASDEARPVLTHPAAPAEIASPPLSEQLAIQAQGWEAWPVCSRKLVLR